MKATVKRHRPTGAMVWFPNDGMSGVIVQAAHPWKLGMVSSHWDYSDLEQTEFEIEIKLKRKEK